MEACAEVDRSIHGRRPPDWAFQNRFPRSPPAQTPVRVQEVIATGQVQPQRLIEFGNHSRSQLSDARPEAPDVNRSDLFRLGFGRACQSGRAGVEQRLKGGNACHVGCHRDNGHHTMAKSRRPQISAVVAHSYHGASLIGLGAAHGLQVREADLAALTNAAGRQRRWAPKVRPRRIVPTLPRPARRHLPAPTHGAARLLAGRRLIVTRCHATLTSHLGT